MFKLFVIIFREILETPALLGIIMAATEEIAGRAKYLWAGAILGAKGAAVTALVAHYIFGLHGGYGQEIVNAAILLLAVSMIVWILVWVRPYTQKLTARIKDRTKQVKVKALPLTSLTIITASLVFKEGLEVALFSYGVLTTTTESLSSLLISALGGFSLTLIIGFLIYKSAIKLLGKHLFQVTSVMLALIAAGMAAEAANFLVASGLISVFQETLWDSSWLISQNSTIGQILHVLTGYIESPNVLELIFYLTTLVLAVVLPRFVKC